MVLILPNEGSLLNVLIETNIHEKTKTFKSGFEYDALVSSFTYQNWSHAYLSAY